MDWNRPRAEKRINDFLAGVPQTSVSVETFEQRYERSIHEMAGTGRGTLGHNPLVKIPPSQAVLVNGVHIYVQLTDYHSILEDAQRDREERHKRALKFLHTHYSASDQVVIEYEAQRVDYHGSRLHAVIATPAGPASELQRVRRAIDFAMAIMRMIEVVGAKVLGGEFATGVRIGIDSGIAVAVNSGRGDEQEPLFLGNPANYAAKLADGDEPGIYLSDRVRTLLGMPQVGGIFRERQASYFREAVGSTRVARSMTDIRIETLSEDLRLSIEPQLRDAEFHFHRHQPPLSTIDYSALRPSNTIHMHMLSIFADIDGFTPYVQRCIDTGAVKELVSNLHVIRKEMAAVLKSDFNGRKVRFIGDCLHGLLAEGDRSTTDAAATVESGVLCAGGMRSSFELCQRMLPGVSELGLAIGMEYGTTPVSTVLVASKENRRGRPLFREIVRGIRNGYGDWSKLVGVAVLCVSAFNLISGLFHVQLVEIFAQVVSLYRTWVTGPIVSALTAAGFHLSHWQVDSVIVWTSLAFLLIRTQSSLLWVRRNNGTRGVLTLMYFLLWPVFLAELFASPYLFRGQSKKNDGNYLVGRVPYMDPHVYVCDLRISYFAQLGGALAAVCAVLLTNLALPH